MSIFRRSYEPVVRACELTGEEFVLSSDELRAYDEFKIPLPRLCPEERYRRQLSFKNDEKFFWRTCDATDAKIYSVFPPTSPFPVVSPDYWWSDKWDPLTFGREFDFKRLFLEQLLELWWKVPRPAYTARNALRSAAVQNARDISDCFLVFNANSGVRCCNSVGLWNSKECADCYYVQSCLQCYECIHCYRCRLLRWSEHCEGCEDSWFLSGCRNCRHCLFCANLEGKSYHIYNQPVTPDEFERALKEWNFGARPKVEYAKEHFSEFLADKPVPHIFSDDPRNTGNYLRRSSGAVDSFECTDCRDIMHCHSLTSARACLDGVAFGGALSQSALFVSCGGRASNLLNCVDCWNNVSNLTYCTYCEDSSHLFGCVGMRGKQYCIFNTQYSKKKYFELVGDITEHLKEREVWGTFLPPNFSGFAYNHSSADEYMPLARVSAQMMGYRWDDSTEVLRPSQLLGSGEIEPSRKFAEMPSTLADMTDAQVEREMFLCELSGKPFRVTRMELELYRLLEVAPPSRAFEQRHRARVMKLAPKRLQTRQLSEAAPPVRTAFPKSWRRPVAAYADWLAIVRKG